MFHGVEWDIQDAIRMPPWGVYLIDWWVNGLNLQHTPCLLPCDTLDHPRTVPTGRPSPDISLLLWTRIVAPNKPTFMIIYPIVFEEAITVGLSVIFLQCKGHSRQFKIKLVQTPTSVFMSDPWHAIWEYCNDHLIFAFFFPLESECPLQLA